MLRTLGSRSAAEDAQQATQARRERAGEAVRQAATEWRGRRLKEDEEYLKQARESRERVLALRQAAKESKEEVLLEKRRAASREARNSEMLAAKVRKSRRAELQGRRNEVAEVFKQRFVGRSEEEAWAASPLRKPSTL